MSDIPQQAKDVLLWQEGRFNGLRAAIEAIEHAYADRIKDLERRINNMQGRLKICEAKLNQVPR